MPRQIERQSERFANSPHLDSAYGGGDPAYSPDERQAIDDESGFNWGPPPELPADQLDIEPHPESHQIDQSAPHHDDGFGTFGHDGYDYEGMTRAEFNHRMRQRGQY